MHNAHGSIPMKLEVLKHHLDKLHSFLIVAQIGSISSAAPKVATSQAALSRSIQSLERALGVSLFIRTKSGVTLTDSGRILMEFARRVLLDTREIETRIRSPESANPQRVRVGTHEALSVHFWPKHLETTFREHPHLNVSLMSGRIDFLTKGLLNQDFDVIVGVLPKESLGFHRVPLTDSSLGFFVSAAKPLPRYPELRKAELSLAEANRVPLLTDTQAHLTQELSMVRFLAQKGFQLSDVFELNSFEAAAQFASRGIGIAVLPLNNGLTEGRSASLRRIRIRECLGKDFGRHHLFASFLTEPRSGSPLSQMLRSLQKAHKKPY